MSITAKDVKEIMLLLENSSFDILSLEVDGVKIELERKGTSGHRAPRAKRSSTPDVAPTEASPPPPSPKSQRPTDEDLTEIRSPLLGVYYRAPKPGEPPFVQEGSRVDAQTIIGVVEVMKLMNAVVAGVTGEVVEILGRNGELVEHGEVLMLIRPEV